MGAWGRTNISERRPRTPATSGWSWRSPAGGSNRHVDASARLAESADAHARDPGLDRVPNGRAPRRAGSKPVPRMPKSRPDTRVRSPVVTLAGTLLIIGLTVLAFAGGRLFGRVDEPTPESPVEVVDVAAADVPQAPPVIPTEPPLAEQTPIPLPASFPRAPVVCLDPGHGGSDRGFSRFFDDGSVQMEEATVVLDHAWDLDARLRHRGYDVVMTRETDADVNVDGRDVNRDGRTAAHDAPRSNRNKNLDELQARINVCNKAGADLLVSMHVNGFSNGVPHGPETWFTRERTFGDRNAAFATLAYQHLKEQLGYIGYVMPDEERGAIPDSTADVQKEYKVFQHFIMTGPEQEGVVQPSEMPGAIVEALFISNDVDSSVLATPEGRNAIVTAYENAIVEYFEWYPPEAR
jgi:N-acetylmuramoyl-L-alanine amidase